MFAATPTFSRATSVGGNLPTLSGNTFEWDDPHPLRPQGSEPGRHARRSGEPVTDIKGASPCAAGRSVTTDPHLAGRQHQEGTPPRSTWRPTGSFKPANFNSAGSRRQSRGDDPRHLSANIRLRNQLLDDVSRRLHPRLHPAGPPGVPTMPRKLRGTRTPAGRLGSEIWLGLVQDWAAKGTRLLGSGRSSPNRSSASTARTSSCCSSRGNPRHPTGSPPNQARRRCTLNDHRRPTTFDAGCASTPPEPLHRRHPAVRVAA